jgi:hypothetical protein
MRSVTHGHCQRERTQQTDEIIDPPIHVVMRALATLGATEAGTVRCDHAVPAG